MKFRDRVAGIPCQVRVTYYHPGADMRITGSGFGDCDPPEPEEFEFDLLDRNGARAPWLEEKLTDEDTDRLLNTYKELKDEP